MINFDSLDYSVYDFLPCGAVIFRVEDYKIIYSNKLYNETFYSDYIRVHEEDAILVKQRIDMAKGPVSQYFRSLNSWNDEVYVRMHIVKDGHGNAFALIVDDTQKMIEQEELMEKALIDPLTKVYNRATAIEEIKTCLKNLNEYEECALIVFDIDNFKNINDTYGHIYGDAVIAMTAGSIKSVLDDADIIGRFGGDEFFIFARDLKRDELENKLESIRLAMMKMRIEADNENDISCSMGVSIGHVGVTYEEMFAQADSALYGAKKNGKNRFEYFSGKYENKSTLTYSGEGINVGDEIESRKERNITTVALEIASKSPTTESAVTNLMRHIGVAAELDCIQIMKFDTVEDKVSLEYQWWRETGGLYNVVFTEPKSGYYQHNDLMLFRKRFQSDNVFQYTPDFKDGFSKKYYDVFKGSENISIVYCSNNENDDAFYALCCQSWNRDRVWTQQEFDDFFEITKIISMFMKSANVVSERERALERQANYTRYGFYRINKFYEEASRIRREAEIRGERLGMVNFDIKHFYQFNRVHGSEEGNRILDEFGAFLNQGESDRIITCFISGTDMFVSLFRYNPEVDARAIIEEKLSEFCASMGEYKEYPLVIKAGLVYTKPGLSLATAMDLSKELKHGISPDRCVCIAHEMTDDDIF